MNQRFATSGTRRAVLEGLFAVLLIQGCTGDAVVRSPATSSGAGKVEPERTLSPEFETATSAAVLEGTAAVVALREPSKPIDADAIGEQLLDQLRSGVATRVLDAFTEDLTITGGSARMFGTGPASRQILTAMVNYPGELQELAGLRFRELRIVSRRSLQESTSGFLATASRALPPASPGELLLVAKVESPTRVLFPTRARVLLILRETQGGYRIRAMLDE